MTNFVKLYVRNYLTCNYFKTFRQQKQELLKLLFISNRYWQDIVCDFVTNLFSCKSDDRFYRHILVIIDRLFKIKKFILMNFMNIKVMIQTFFNYVWRCENFLLFIISDRDITFVAHFWKKLCKRLNIIFKLFIAFHLKINK